MPAAPLPIDAAAVSWKATNWAKLWRLGGTNRKAVLMVLADYASETAGPDGALVPDGLAVCWASNDMIAADAEVGERTVRRLLAGFEAVGIVRRDRRHDRRGHRKSDAVWLPIGELPRSVGADLDRVLAAQRGPVGPVDNSPP